MYVAAAAHEDDDYRPYVLRSTDLGRSWTSIARELPAGGPIFSLAEDPVNPALLFAGSEFGIWATIDGGARWFSLRLNLPTVPVHDIVVHPRERDLVIGTHGRGIWILDSIRALEGLTAEVMSRSGALFTPRPAMLLTRFDRGRSSLGDTYFTAPNPPDGAYLDYFVNPSASGPVSLEVYDAAGALVRRLDVDETARGLRRTVWDLRAEPAAAAAGRGGRGAGGGRGGGAGGGGGGGRGGRGASAAPGTYEARLTVGSDVYRALVAVRPDPAGR
jgi:hypothetical protein